VFFLAFDRQPIAIDFSKLIVTLLDRADAEQAPSGSSSNGRELRPRAPWLHMLAAGER